MMVKKHPSIVVYMTLRKKKQAMFEEIKKKMNTFWNDDRTLEETDPEFVEIFSRFAYDDVIHEPHAQSDKLSDTDRCIAIIAACIGAQGMDAFDMMLPVAYHTGVTSIQLKEVIYQATAYTGFAHSLPFLKKLNAYLNAENVALPLPSQATTQVENRQREGEQKQVDLFGEQMRGFATSGPEDIQHIHRWLSENCFGDYVTRSGLTDAQREMITVCFLMAQGGCESQLKAHMQSNLHIGNDKQFLIALISQCLPYIGYPRALNALQCLSEVTQ